MKSEKGITLVSLLVYIAVLLTVMVVIGRISSMFNKQLEYVTSENDAATAFSTVDACILTETKKKDNTVSRVGIMNGYKDSGFYFQEQGGSNLTAVEFSSKNIICCLNKSIYFNKTKICDNVNNFKVKYNKSNSSSVPDAIEVNMQIGEKTYNHTYTFR